MSEANNEDGFKEIVEILDDFSLSGLYVKDKLGNNKISIDDYNAQPDFLERLALWTEACKQQYYNNNYLRLKTVLLERKDYSDCDSNCYAYLPYLAFCGVRLETEAERSARLEQVRLEQFKKDVKLQQKEEEDLREYERLKKKFEGKNNAL